MKPLGAPPTWDEIRRRELAKGATDGLHFDEGKLDWSLLPFDAVEDMVAVLMYGARKYGKTNWQKGIAFTRVWNSAMRHLLAWRKQIDTDPESGLPHLAHAMCNIMFLTFFSKDAEIRKKFDNRKEG